MNPSETICTQHSQKYGMFCPQCSQFLCCDCDCPHFPEVKPIPMCFMNKYFEQYTSQFISANKDQISIAKKQLIDLYNEEEEKLSKAFKKAIEHLDTFIAMGNKLEEMKTQLTEMGVNDKAFAVINSFAEKKNSGNMDQVSSEKSYMRFVEKATNIIKEISCISVAFNDLHQMPNISSLSLSTSNNSTVHYLSNNQLFIHNIMAKSTKAITLLTNLNSYAESIACLDRIYFIGGNGPIADTFEVDVSKSNLIPKCPMLCKKYIHTLSCTDSIIYSVGGYNDAASIGDCEKYDVIANKWIQLPELLTARRVCASFVVNKSNVYALGGYSSTEVNSLEKLNITLHKNWELVHVTDMFTPRYGMHGIQIRSDTVIVFGAFKSAGIEGNESFLFKFSETSVKCTKHVNMDVPTYFYWTTAPVFDGKCVYGVSNDKKIHKYSLETQTWSIMH